MWNCHLISLRKLTYSEGSLRPQCFNEIIEQKHVDEESVTTDDNKKSPGSASKRSKTRKSSQKSYNYALQMEVQKYLSLEMIERETGSMV